jgi:hypothetical protein
MNPGDLPAITCDYAGASPNEGVLVYAAADDFRGIGLMTYDRARIGAFLVAFGSQAISDELTESIDGAIRVANMPESRCPFPCEVVTSGPEFGRLEGRVEVYEDLLMVAILQESGF